MRAQVEMSISRLRSLVLWVLPRRFRARFAPKPTVTGGGMTWHLVDIEAFPRRRTVFMAWENHE